MSDLIDVRGDGHCGFRAAAHILFESEEKWLEVRSLLVDQYKLKFKYYNDFFLYHSKREQDEFLQKIQHEGQGRVTRKKWFISPEMTQILADATSRIVVVINNKCEYKCNTFLPLFGEWNVDSPPITLVNFNGNHWVAGTISDDYLPPLDLAQVPNKALTWTRQQLELVESKMNKWREIFPPPKTTRNATLVDLSGDV
ncbi:MAG TPA: OTU domain-containing protein [Phormidium sp.]